MKNALKQTVANPSFRSPTLADGKTLYQLAKAVGGLDVNSEYAYLLAGLHHTQTSVIAEIDGQPAGFITGYSLHGAHTPHCLFIWQVGVHPDFRGIGLGQQMILDICNRPENKHFHFFETTITPSNNASKRMFESVATTLGAPMLMTGRLEANIFSQGHEAETIYRVGPFNQ